MHVRLSYSISKVAIVILTSVMCFGGVAEAQQRGIMGQQAPQWGVTEWSQLPKGTNTIDVGDFKGKVVYLYCFQAWCPGCHAKGFPTLKTLVNKYGKDEKVAFVAVQTAFEGYKSNTPKRGFACAKRYDLDIPFGHSGSPKKRSTVMERYRTGGTPWTVIIDAQGKVRFNAFHISPEQGVQLLDALKAEIAVKKEDQPAPVGPVRAPETPKVGG